MGGCVLQAKSGLIVCWCLCVCAFLPAERKNDIHAEDMYTYIYIYIYKHAQHRLELLAMISGWQFCW